MPVMFWRSILRAYSFEPVIPVSSPSKNTISAAMPRRFSSSASASRMQTAAALSFAPQLPSCVS